MKRAEDYLSGRYKKSQIRQCGHENAPCRPATSEGLSDWGGGGSGGGDGREETYCALKSMAMFPGRSGSPLPGAAPSQCQSGAGRRAVLLGPLGPLWWPVWAFPNLPMTANWSRNPQPTSLPLSFTPFRFALHTDISPSFPGSLLFSLPQAFILFICLFIYLWITEDGANPGGSGMACSVSWMPSLRCYLWDAITHPIEKKRMGQDETGLGEGDILIPFC